MSTEPVLDLMRRTLANLEFIEARAGPAGPYEVTQLINSFLGALAHPWEAMKDDLMKLELVEAANRGWPRLLKERPQDCDPESLGQLLRLLRNGFAHGNIEYLSDVKQQIAALRVWNKNGHGRRTWGTIISIPDTRKLISLFCNLIEERHRTHGWYISAAA